MNDKQYIVSIDQSTSGSKAILVDEKANVIARSKAEHQQLYPKPGWVEHDPEELYKNCIEIVGKVIDKSAIEKEQIKCLSITNQRETVVVWDKRTGKPVYNAIVWQCMRGEEFCNTLKRNGHEGRIRAKTGLIIDPYFSASGINWILQNVPQVKEDAQNGHIAAGTIDSWLIWKLTNGKVHATDYSNASRTLLLNLYTLRWEPEICDLFEIPINILPTPKPADEIFGETTIENLLETAIPISGILGDSHAALFGQKCFHSGLSKVTYGTGSSVMMNIGVKPQEAPEGLMTSVGYILKNNTCFVYEGNIHSTGATIKWMIDSLGLIRNSAESEKIATSVDSTDGVYFVPAFAGLGAPYWNNHVRANISGIHGGTKKAHFVRAGLESIAYQVKDLLDLMVSKANIKLSELRVDGGPTSNSFLMQFQSNMLDTPISINDIEEASALGAALAGGLGVGIWNDLQQLEDLDRNQNRVTPKMSSEERDNLYAGWIKAVRLTLENN